MRVLGSKGHRGRESVMELVDWGIEEGMVEQPVRIVEEYLPEEHTEENVPDKFCDAGKIGIETEVWFVAQCEGKGGKKEMQGRGEQLVAEDDLNTMDHLVLVGLLVCGL